MNGTDCKEKHKSDRATQQIKYHRTLAPTLHIFYNADILMLILDNANDVRDVRKDQLHMVGSYSKKTNVDTYITLYSYYMQDSSTVGMRSGSANRTRRSVSNVEKKLKAKYRK